jgi:hypothetical protein
VTNIAAAPLLDWTPPLPKYMSKQKAAWWEWHKDNPHVYELFQRFTFQAINRGHDNLSAWLIINRIRWETSIETTGADFKISNNCIAYYARQFMQDYPEYKGFFSTKKMKDEAE